MARTKENANRQSATYVSKVSYLGDNTAFTTASTTIRNWMVEINRLVAVAKWDHHHGFVVAHQGGIFELEGDLAYVDMENVDVVALREVLEQLEEIVGAPGFVVKIYLDFVAVETLLSWDVAGAPYYNIIS